MRKGQVLSRHGVLFARGVVFKTLYKPVLKENYLGYLFGIATWNIYLE